MPLEGENCQEKEEEGEHQMDLVFYWGRGGEVVSAALYGFVWLLRPLFLFNYVTGVNVRRAAPATAALPCPALLNQVALISFYIYIQQQHKQKQTNFEKTFSGNFQYMFLVVSPGGGIRKGLICINNMI